MALSDPYAFAEDYRKWKGAQDGGNDIEIERDLTAVSRHIDLITARQLGFNRDPSSDDSGPVDPVARIFPATGHCTLDIWDHVSISIIEIDDGQDNTFATELDAADYELLPRNATTMSEQQPYRQIEATRWGSLGVWPAGCRVRVTGYGGWPSVPQAIFAATIELTAILRLESARATSRVNEVGTVIATSRAGQSIVNDLVTRYRNPRSYI